MKRGGFTLIEMVVSITVVSFVVATVTMTLALLWRVQSDVQRELFYVESATRLARQIRADAHLATKAALTPAAPGRNGVLQLNQPNADVEYSLEPHRIVRVSRQAERAMHREVFMLGESAAASWSTRDSQPPLVRVVITRQHEQLGDPAVASLVAQIDAVVGLILETEE